MFDQVGYIRELCKARKIPISRLERDLGFSNGYLTPGKVIKIPYDRAVSISSYLGVSVESLYGNKREKPAGDDGSGLKFALFGEAADQISEEALREVLRFAEFVKAKELGK